jgi:zinc-ribbon domain
MFCPSCGMELAEGAKFCKACGKPIVGAQPPPPAAPLPGYPVQPQAAAGPRRSKAPIIMGLAALAVVIIVVVVILVFTLGGDGGVAGTYSNTEDGVTIAFELKPDGTFTFSEDISIPVEGTYEVNGNKLIMHMKMFDLAYTYDVEGTIEGGKINIDGTIYVKQ